MASDRAAIFAEVLEELEVDVWRSTRYANNTGTCMWCRSGALVMVPDDPSIEWFVQAEGAEELQARLAPLIEPRLARSSEDAAVAAAAVDAEMAALGPGVRELVAIGQRLRQEGYQEALVEARAMFAGVMRSKFGDLPPIVEQRIEKAEFYQLKRWSERLFTLPRAVHVVA